MPVVNAVIVPILPDDGQGIGPYRNDIADPCGGCIPQFDLEHLRIGLSLHVLMSPAAGGARAGRPQQLKRIDARMAIIPRDREFTGLFIGSNTGRFFVHTHLFANREESKSAKLTWRHEGFLAFFASSR